VVKGVCFTGRGVSGAQSDEAGLGYHPQLCLVRAVSIPPGEETGISTNQSYIIPKGIKGLLPSETQQLHTPGGNPLPRRPVV